MSEPKPLPASLTGGNFLLTETDPAAAFTPEDLTSEQRLMAQTAGLTPGGSINPLVLTQALYDDVAADGFFDGQGSAGRLILPPGVVVSDGGPTTATALDGQTLRGGLAQAIAKFASSDRNVTRITVADAQQLLTALAANTDGRLFRSGSGGGAADIEAPSITFVKPSMDMLGAAGSFDVDRVDRRGLDPDEHRAAPRFA